MPLATPLQALTMECPTCQAKPGQRCRRIAFENPYARRYVSQELLPLAGAQHGARHRAYADWQAVRAAIDERHQLAEWFKANGDLFEQIGKG